MPHKGLWHSATLREGYAWGNRKTAITFYTIFVIIFHGWSTVLSTALLRFCTSTYFHQYSHCFRWVSKQDNYFVKYNYEISAESLVHRKPFTSFKTMIKQWHFFVYCIHMNVEGSSACPRSFNMAQTTLPIKRKFMCGKFVVGWVMIVMMCRFD